MVTPQPLKSLRRTLWVTACWALLPGLALAQTQRPAQRPTQAPAQRQTAPGTAPAQRQTAPAQRPAQRTSAPAQRQTQTPPPPPLAPVQTTAPAPPPPKAPAASPAPERPRATGSARAGGQGEPVAGTGMRPGVAVKLDTTVNSASEEIYPLLSPDRQTLYFTRSLSPQNVGGKEAGQDIWYSRRGADGAFGPAINIGPPINNREHNALAGISADGNTLYVTNVYGRRDRMEPGLTMFTRASADAPWGAPVPMPIDGFAVQRGYFGAYVTPDGQTLILSMKDEQAVGREDLYACQRKPGANEWMRPVNIGRPVNTVGFETSPYYNPTDSMLYFSSNGLEGLGDADIYRSKRLDDSWTKWSRPQNMGRQVNTEGFDAYFMVAHDSTAYFVREAADSRFTDIYTIIFTDPSRRPPRDSTQARRGRNNNLREGDDEDEDDEDDEEAARRAAAAKAEEERRRQFLTDRDPRTPAEIQRDLINRVRQSGKGFESILFDFGSSKLRPEGRRVLDKALAYLREHPTQAIELVGHTDSVAGDMLNQILSDKRAYAAKEYLMRHGISRNRILTHGFGKQIYVAENESDRGRQLNRRCELNLLIDPEEFRQYYQKEAAVVPDEIR